MPRIPDPKMNPTGERAYGIVSNEDDGHYDIYIKKDSGNPQDSRYLTTGTKVNFATTWPALLVTFKNKKEFLDDYDNATFKKGDIEGGIRNLERFREEINELKSLLSNSESLEMVTIQWEGAPEIPVIVDYTDELSYHTPDPGKPGEPVKEQLREQAFDYLRKQ